jgi:hypothetical protein
MSDRFSLENTIMRLRFFLPAKIIAVSCALGWVAGSGRLAVAFE